MDRRARGVLERQTGQLARLVDELLERDPHPRGQNALSWRAWTPAIWSVACDEVARGLRRAPGVAALSVDVGATPAWVQVSAARVSRVIGNLLGNALVPPRASGWR